MATDRAIKIRGRGVRHNVERELWEFIDSAGYGPSVADRDPLRVSYQVWGRPPLTRPSSHL